METEMDHLPILCPQEYTAKGMSVIVCDHCSNWSGSACGVFMGVERDPVVAGPWPDCPISERCQHQIQRGDRPCKVRERGMVCESAMVFGGMDEDDAAQHPLAFNGEYWCCGA